MYERAVKNGKKRGVGFVVPWNVDCVDGAERAALLAVAPLPLKLVWRATRGRYDRLVASAFDSVPPVTAVTSPVGR